MEKEIEKGYVIGIDGGGTKTVAALADAEGKILKISRASSSHPRNLGLKRAIENLAQAISLVLKGIKKEKISSTFIGLPAVAEEYKFKIGKIKKELKKHKKISKIFEGKLVIDSDQKVAYRAGADGDGVMLNSGTGCVAHGWKMGKEAHASGWGWLGDEGGAFFIGQKVFQAVLKDLDGRGKKTLLTKLIFKKLKLRDEEDFLNFVYQKNPTEVIPLLSVFCDFVSKKGDGVAKKIVIEAAEEAALAAKAVIKKLNFQKSKFPSILVGSLFKSEIFLEIVKREVKKIAPKTKFILLKKEPVIGAVKLAIENLKNEDL
jgi:N-acetylglucosamine kinase-like BadF-type ATPase